jgi:CheY-like chemotaxis protein
MLADEIYALTAHGERELRSAGTRLSAAEIALLVRFDGQLTVEQVRSGLSPAAREAFDATFRTLRDRKLIALVEVDPFESRFHVDMGNLAQLVGQAEADAGLASLQRSGFYVQIARERTDRAPRPPGQPLSVLVVEDEPVLARFVESYLKLSGFDVRQAGDRASVVAELRRLPSPDLVLMDVSLPDADGFDILVRMRQHPVLKTVPVVMLTGKATRQAVIKGIAGGADGYVTKPFEPDAMMRAVRTVLGLRQPDGSDPWSQGDARWSRAGRTPSASS